MELNREQIVKALECCAEGDCDGCPSYPFFGCTKANMAVALALIRELTEENERLRGVGLPDYSTYIRLSDAKTAIMAYIGEQTVSKYASQAECKAARSGAEGAMNELDHITPAQVSSAADTVRKMQGRLKESLVGFSDEFRYWAEGYFRKIAKELLEEA